MAFESPLDPILANYEAAIAADRWEDLSPLLDEAAAIRVTSQADIRAKIWMLANHGSHAGNDLVRRYLAWANADAGDLEGLRAYSDYAEARLSEGWDAPARLAISLVQDTLTFAVACWEASQVRSSPSQTPMYLQ